tara:strand:- start:6211 stop:6450 length:240 start_codon:yes stop_codon:yes gene_type:complete
MSEEKIDYLRDNDEAHQVINMCLQQIGERLAALEQFVQGIPLQDVTKIMYKPDGYEEYLDTKQNFDEIYRRLEELKGGV